MVVRRRESTVFNRSATALTPPKPRRLCSPSESILRLRINEIFWTISGENCCIWAMRTTAWPRNFSGSIANTADAALPLICARTSAALRVPVRAGLSGLMSTRVCPDAPRSVSGGRLLPALSSPCSPDASSKRRLASLPSWYQTNLSVVHPPTPQYSSVWRKPSFHRQKAVPLVHFGPARLSVLREPDL